ncbi:uncharacterized protein A4U43_C07F26940 [Asparagus officinalis]|uniref:Uncharacterized protein n=1 Tax=Asparagus officinalis TaxID=4686 RepID=A0A5P1EI34_ASPOF|nr:uncharacterized protein A4U43_C07F26940 [Asparagus officinalis]
MLIGSHLAIEGAARPVGEAPSHSLAQFAPLSASPSQFLNRRSFWRLGLAARGSHVDPKCPSVSQLMVLGIPPLRCLRDLSSRAPPRCFDRSLRWITFIPQALGTLRPGFPCGVSRPPVPSALRSMEPPPVWPPVSRIVARRPWLLRLQASEETTLWIPDNLMLRQYQRPVPNSCEFSGVLELLSKLDFSEPSQKSFSSEYSAAHPLSSSDECKSS